MSSFVRHLTLLLSVINLYVTTDSVRVKCMPLTELPLVTYKPANAIRHCRLFCHQHHEDAVIVLEDIRATLLQSNLIRVCLTLNYMQGGVGSIHSSGT